EELTDEQVQSYSACMDAAGRLLLPGLMDSHIHVSMTGESIHFVDLKECLSIEQLVVALKTHISLHSDLSWIVGVNWDQTKLGRYPTRHDIDAVSAGVKVFLWRACWHIGLANSAALTACGIDLTKAPEAPPGGVIDFDGTSVTGILRERAVEVVMREICNKSNEEKKRFIKNGLDMCLRYGLTTVQTNDEGAMGIYQELMAADMLPIRVFLTPTHTDIFGSGDDARVPTSRLLVDRVKIFSDGSLGAETAALRLERDSSAAESERTHKGVLMHKAEAMRCMIAVARSNGYRLEVHAIGDAAAEQVLLAMRDCGITPSDRAILTHCQVLGRDLIDLMREMGVIANIQPSFVPTDMEWASARLTSDVLEFSYAWRTLMQDGVWCAGGSDAPIETCSPWVGIYDAIFRERRTVTFCTDAADGSTDVFRPEECLSFAEALWMYTVGGAFAGNCEGSLGRIENGTAADFVVVDPSI
ncbi:unnamed protein product, partial [Ectocarpus fasciculatus]